MIVLARAPTRVDLAGGTLDIHPLYLLEDDIWTVNAAIEIPVRVRLARARAGYTLASKDLGQRVRAASLDALPLGGPMDLAARALRLAGPPPGLKVTLDSAAPPGSGLGASSALLVTLLAALDRLQRRRRSVEDLVRTAWELEAQSLRTLTGRQDYLAAVRGGVNAIRFGIGGDEIEPLRAGRSLQERLVLAYTGQPHASGLTNWGVVRAYLDGVPSTVNHLRSIAGVARQMRQALLDGDLDAVGPLLAEEWTHRRELAPGVSTPAIERAMATARRHGALAGKACGAGGGGSVLFVVRADAKRSCEQALRSAGFAVLPVRIARRGLRVRAMV
jgi:D-glycero-alpha-D-manno-heptose-7-phosphate kinase